MTGDHRTDIVGKPMFCITDAEKRPEDDADVIIENDVWIGANAIVLKGVTIYKKQQWDDLAKRVICTGPIDAYFKYSLGALQYRSVQFETQVLDQSNF